MNHVAQFIVDEFAPDLEASQLDPDYDLLDGGIVDSLGLLTIVAWIEDSTGAELDLGAIGEYDLRTVRSIEALMDETLAVAPG